MVLKKEKKEEIIKKFAQGQADTGSPEVQIALLTERINTLSEHLKINKKDNHSRHGLLLLVSHRKKLVGYLQRESAKRYETLAATLGLR